MVKKIRLFKNNDFIYITLEEYLIEYHSQIPEGWILFNNRLIKVVESENESEKLRLVTDYQVEDFNIIKFKDSLNELIYKYTNFDQDILRFISFLKSTSYFEKIGNPTLNQWFNSIDINHPFKKTNESYSGYTFFEAIEFVNGQNAIRKSLLSTLPWISSQIGS